MFDDTTCKDFSLQVANLAIILDKSYECLLFSVKITQKPLQHTTSYSVSLNLQIASFSYIINYKSLPELRLIIHFCNLYDLCLEKKRASLEIICDECFIFANRKNIFTAININKR